MPTRETYDDRVIRLFLMAAAVWGVIGMSIGVLAAAQMAWPALNFDVSWLTFSRIRANHTFGVIFAFGGSALMGTCYYIVQRTGHVRLAFGKLAMFTFWGKCGTPSRAAPLNRVRGPVSLSRSMPSASTNAMSFQAAGGLATWMLTLSTPAAQAALSASSPPMPPEGTNNCAPLRLACRSWRWGAASSTRWLIPAVCPATAGMEI